MRLTEKQLIQIDLIASDRPASMHYSTKGALIKGGYMDEKHELTDTGNQIADALALGVKLAAVSIAVRPPEEPVWEALRATAFRSPGDMDIFGTALIQTSFNWLREDREKLHAERVRPQEDDHNDYIPPPIEPTDYVPTHDYMFLVMQDIRNSMHEVDPEELTEMERSIKDRIDHVLAPPKQQH